MQGALRARLLAAFPVTALVAQRVYWVDRPQASALPSITLQVISSDRPQTHDGLQALRTSRVQLDVWAATYAQGRSIVEAVIPALLPRGVTSNGVLFDQIQFESESDSLEQAATVSIYRTRIDLIVWHSPA